MTRQNRITEGSCRSCRKRRLRCDLVKPQCSRCQTDAQECLYGTTTQLKWVGGTASRGRFAPSPPSSASTSPPRRMSQIMTVITPSSPRLESSDLLLYFNNAILPRFQIPDKAVEIDFQTVMQNQPLQQAILAVARAHYAMNSKIVDSETLALQKHARSSALESFRLLLQGGITNEAAAHDLFSINILLCMLDGIIEPSTEHNASICHLKGGFAILSQWTNTSTRMLVENGLQGHLLSVFATMDLVHAILNGNKPFFDSLIWCMFADVQTWFGTLSINDEFLTILKIYSEMASLGHIIHSQLPALDGMALVARCSAGFQHVLEAPTSHASQSATNSDHWSVFCSIYRLAGTIYMERALRLRTISDDAVQDATRRGVAMLVDDILPGMLSHCLIFPILVIGSQCIHSQDRKAVLEALSPSSTYLSFGSLQLMVNFLQELWKNGRQDMNWWQCFEPISKIAFLF